MHKQQNTDVKLGRQSKEGTQIEDIREKPANGIKYFFQILDFKEEVRI